MSGKAYIGEVECFEPNLLRDGLLREIRFRIASVEKRVHQKPEIERNMEGRDYKLEDGTGEEESSGKSSSS